jgi:hypothetical protein
MNRKEHKIQTHFDSEQRLNNYASDLYIDEENDNEVENYNQGKELSILIRNDYNYNSITNNKNNNNNYNDGTVLKIINKQTENLEDIKYLDENDSDEYLSDEEDSAKNQSLPFPIPHETNTLTRTDLKNKHNQAQSQTTTTTRVLSPNWLKLKTKMDTLNRNESIAASSASSPSKAWSNVRKMLKTAPTNTKLFLGIDSSNNVPLSLGGNDIVRVGTAGGGGAGGGPVNRNNLGGSGVTTVDSGRLRAANGNDVSTSSAAPIPIYKTLNNWNERTFRVLNSNLIFGGKIKEKALDNYLENLDEDAVDVTDPFLHYKTTGNQIDRSKRISVANLAMNGVRKVLNVI